VLITWRGGWEIDEVERRGWFDALCVVFGFEVGRLFFL
jgi:hypothetical protein